MPHLDLDPSTARALSPVETIPAGARARVDSGRSDDPSRLDRWADRLVDRAVPAATAMLVLLMLATWVPHYLGWPWWPDLDIFATMALAWSEGLRPYRDIAGYSFPGQIYLFYGLHALFGPGRTWPIYAVDAAMVGGFGLALTCWSRRRFGRVWPGLIGASAFLAFYANLNFSLVAQRDWHATFFVMLALLAPTSWKGRGGRVLSALATGLAVAFRPHIVVFGPALLLAVIEGDGRRGRGRVRPVLEWLGVAAATSVVVFLPLIAAGVLDDLVRNIRLVSYGSHYNRTTPAGMVAGVIRQGIELRWVVVPGAVALLARMSGESIRRESRIWLVAAAGVLLYKPIHPRPHDYLDLPRWLVWSVLLALLAACVVAMPALTGRIRLAAVVAVLAAAVPSKPAFCNPAAAVAAIQGLDHGPPPGYVHHMTPYQAELYPWDDYREALTYLRDEIRPESRVANLLSYQLPAVGVSGRLPVFLNEAGLLWKSQVGWNEEVFINQIEAATDAVVIWSPTTSGPEPNLVSPGLREAVRRHYEPEAAFGPIEVWRRQR